MKKGLISFISICLLLLLWQLTASYMNQPELIPSVPDLIKALFQLFATDTFYKSIFATVLRGISGILLSLAAAILAAFLFARYELLYELFRPLLTIMRSVPVISFILLALIFLDPEGIPLMIAFLTMFPLLAENLTKGIINLKPGLSLMASQFRISRKNKLIHIYYPQLKPFLFSGLVSAIGFGWRAIIMGEVLSQCAFGIGGEMKRAQLFISVPELIAWTIIAILISFLFDRGINRLSHIKWNIRFSNTTSEKNYTSVIYPIKMTDVTFQYTDIKVLSHFSYTFEPGIIYGIKAPSGSGKTTLLNLLDGSLKPTKGEISSNKEQIFSVVFQEPELLSHLTVMQNICLPLASAYNHSYSEEKARKTLEIVEMEAFRDRYPNELSYGQQQRVALARALAYPSAIMLLDEPFKGLDKALTIRIIDRMIARQTDQKQTIIFTSHDQEEIDRLASVIIRLQTVN
ncbi:ATP-binding cassette domain-containing protein [Parabacteroides faecis]|uniref:ATP-binding cassette domain-containing protein n=1 Tax=Parabacteroides TaxID=375288 RepID=UPI000EFF3C90|nr:MULTISPECIES: ATP-binding cassette domain-containing protein [Parabacteroides]MBC8618006.1 ATP-binding cassette domain-containing protein [Parabacteroides faecis]RHR99244.1 ATP-binding cassette domain-containing protein [Parabacteroides sp. AF14-59]